MTGAELASRISQEHPSIVVVITSGYFNDEKWSKPVVAKPYNLFETATALAELARSGRRKEGDS